MSRTYIQQYQISGSLNADISDVVLRADLVKEDRSIIDDLNSLRTQVKGILGTSAWTDEQSITLQNLKAQLTGTLNANSGSFAGTLAVVGNSDLDGALDVAGQVDLAAAGVATNVRGNLDVKQAAVFSGSLSLAGDVAQRLYIVDTDGSLKDEANMIFDGSTFKVTGAVSGSGAFDVGGAFTVAGASSLNSTLSVAGAATINGILDVNNTVSASAVKIDSDVAQRLYIVDADGSLKDEENLKFNGSKLTVTGSFESTGPAIVNELTASNGIKISAGGLVIAGDRLEVDGTLDVTGNADFGTLYTAGFAGISGSLRVAGTATVDGVLDVNNTISASAIKIDSDVAQRLYIVDANGSLKDEENMIFDGSSLKVTGNISGSVNLQAGGTLTVAGNSDLNGALDVAGQVDLAAAGVATSVRGTLSVAQDASFAGNVNVDGDLRVKGSMTYIDTQNVRVQDAFIYLATGSLGTSDSGIVLHGGAGVGLDLVLGQDGGAGEFILGKANRSPNGEGEMDGIDLVPAWASGIKLGLSESALSGSLAVDSADVKLSAVEDLKFEAHGNVIKLGSDAEFDSFIAQFGAGASLLGALGAGSGIGISFRKGNINGSAASLVSGKSQLPISSVGSLRNVSDKTLGLDVYLNGVLMSLGVDYTVSVVDRVDFEFALQGDDLVTVVLRNAVVA